MNHIIHKPLISEKSLTLAAKGWFTFAVDSSVNRIEISHAVEKFYNVHVTNIRTITMHGKTRRVGKRMMTTRAQNWKKAIVRLKDGEKISAFEVTQEAPKTT
jgi:large subunit ribosomal protein L23